MQTFKEFYTARHGQWGGETGEPYDQYIARLADTFAEYVDMIANAPLILQASDTQPINTEPGAVTFYRSGLPIHNIRHSTPPPMPDSRRRPRT